jgi:hypothetical protein
LKLGKKKFQFFYILLPVFCTTANSWCVRFESPCIMCHQYLILLKATVSMHILCYEYMYARICTVVDQNKIGQSVTLGPDFKSWWQIGGAAQMCSYLCPTH